MFKRKWDAQVLTKSSLAIHSLSRMAPDVESDCKYYVYQAPNMQTAFTRIAGNLNTTMLGVGTCSGIYMVRAAKAITTGSATFTNFSQGVYYPPQP